jgi:Ran GTPase-activating protein (RanGAP) involved in mRNA processing and transport
MNSRIENCLKELEYKDRIINYLKNIYKIEVGEEALIPDAYISDKKKDLDKYTDDEDLMSKPFQTFEEKVNALRLPDMNDKNIKQKLTKLKKEKDTKILIRQLDLSNYGEKGITPELLRRVVNGMKVLKSVEWIDLRYNHLDDSYSNIICEMLSIDSLKRIDLAHNNLNKVAMKKIINVLKVAKHLEYFDISFNPINDEIVCINVCHAVKFHDKLFHFGMSDLSRDAAVKFVQAKPDLRSINIDDARYKPKTYETVTKLLSEKKYNLAVLSMRYNNVDLVVAHSIARGLRVNKTLVYLNLYNSGIIDLAGEKLITALEVNRGLVELDLSKNKLGELSCQALGNVLRQNSIITKVHICKNYSINDACFTKIIDGLVHNQTLQSLGNLSDLKISLKLRQSVDQLLTINKEFVNNKINLDFNKSQKIDCLRASLEFDSYEKDKREHLEKSIDANSLKDKKKEEEEMEKALLNKYDIKFETDEFEFFNY